VPLGLDLPDRDQIPDLWPLLRAAQAEVERLAPEKPPVQAPTAVAQGA
jgi:hypothetical protein